MLTGCNNIKNTNNDSLTAHSLDTDNKQKNNYFNNIFTGSDIDLDNYTVYFGDKKIVLPCSYKEFVQITGYIGESEYETGEKSFGIYPDNYCQVTLRDKEKTWNEIKCEILNINSETKSIWDCYVVGIIIDHPCDFNGQGIRFAGDLGVGQYATCETITRILGAPDEQDSDEYRSWLKYYFEGGSYNKMGFSQESDPYYYNENLALNGLYVELDDDSIVRIELYNYIVQEQQDE